MKVHKFCMSRNFFAIVTQMILWTKDLNRMTVNLLWTVYVTWKSFTVVIYAQATTNPWKTKLHPICSTKLAKKSCWEHWISCSLWILFLNLNRNNQFTRYFDRYAKYSILNLIVISIMKIIIFDFPRIDASYIIWTTYRRIFCIQLFFRFDISSLVCYYFAFHCACDSQK